MWSSKHFLYHKIDSGNINTDINITILYENVGWSIKIIAGIFYNMTHNIVHRYSNENHSINESQLNNINDSL